MDKILTWFMYLWIALALAINAIAVTGFFWAAHSFWAGWQQVAEVYGPYNVKNYIAELILILPAFGAFLWRERLRKKRATGAPSMSAEEIERIVHAYADLTTKPAEPFPRDLYPNRPRVEAGRVGQKMADDYNAVVKKAQTMVRDAKLLPYPKERIKEALLMAIYLTPAGDAREQLKVGFVLLSGWQDASVSDPLAAMNAEGQALLAELKARGL